MDAILLPETRSDLLAGIDWFESLRSGLGDEFESEFYSALERVKSNPEIFPRDSTGFHPCRLKRFTAVLYFRTSGEFVVVTGLLINGRNEGLLKKRG